MYPVDKTQVVGTITFPVVENAPQKKPTPTIDEIQNSINGQLNGQWVAIVRQMSKGTITVIVDECLVIESETVENLLKIGVGLVGGTYHPGIKTSPLS